MTQTTLIGLSGSCRNLPDVSVANVGRRTLGSYGGRGTREAGTSMDRFCALPRPHGLAVLGSRRGCPRCAGDRGENSKAHYHKLLRKGKPRCHSLREGVGMPGYALLAAAPFAACGVLLLRSPEARSSISQGVALSNTLYRWSQNVTRASQGPCERFPFLGACEASWSARRDADFPADEGVFTVRRPSRN